MRTPSATASRAASRIARAGLAAPRSSSVVREQRRAGEDHRHRVRDVLALERRRRPVRGLGHQRAPARSRRRTRRAATPSRRSSRRAAARGRRGCRRRGSAPGSPSGRPSRRQQRERRVDQLRLVAHVGMPRGGRVHLLLQHPLVGRADRVLRPAEDLRAGALRLAERELGDGAADRAARSARCGTRPRRRPRPRATPSRRRRRRRPCARSRSARGRRRRARRRGSAGPVRTITWPPISSRRIAVRRADVAARLGRDRRRLQPEPVLADRRRRLVDDAVLRRAPRLEREVEARERRTRARSRPARARAAPPRAAPGPSRRPRARRSCSHPWRGEISDADDRQCATGGTAGSGGAARGRSGASATSTRAGTRDHGRGEARADRVARRSRPRGRTSGSRRARGRSCRRPASTRPGGSQYLYHPEYRARQEQAKYDEADPLRRAAARPARGDGRRTWSSTRAAVRAGRAIAVRLINLGWFRVGSDRYARESRTFGITTLREAHVAVRGKRVAFRFRGKHRIMVRTRDRRRRARGGDARAARADAGGRASSATQPRTGSPNLDSAQAERLHPRRISARSSRRRTSGPGAAR